MSRNPFFSSAGRALTIATGGVTGGIVGAVARWAIGGAVIEGAVTGVVTGATATAIRGNFNIVEAALFQAVPGCFMGLLTEQVFYIPMTLTVEVKHAGWALVPSAVTAMFVPSGIKLLRAALAPRSVAGLQSNHS